MLQCVFRCKKCSTLLANGEHVNAIDIPAQVGSARIIMMCAGQSAKVKQEGLTSCSIAPTQSEQQMYSNTSSAGAA